MKTNYKITGTPNSPVLVFSNSLGADMGMWDELIPLLLPYFRVLQYDTRGHGGSEVTAESYSITQLGIDVITLLDELQIEKVYFCGLSMGGLIGQWLSIHHPDRIIKLALSNTDAKIGSIENWNERIQTVNSQGMQAIVEGTMERWFTEDFRNNKSNKIDSIKTVFTSNSTLGYTNSCAAVRDADFRNQLDKIKTETLVLTGDEDTVTTVAHAEELASKIPNASLKVFHARHLMSTELPKEFAEVLIDFFVGTSTYEKGMHVRRTVLGNTHVDKATENINEFNGEFQSFISNYAWGEIWTRPGLSKHNRSLITIAMLIALNRKNELQMHIRAAFNNGVSKDELKEVIMQSALYCGLPAANDAIHTAESVFEALNK